MVLDTQAVIELGLVPLLEVHHQVKLGLHLDGPHTEKLPHVDDADAPQLDIVADDLRRRADELVGNASQLHGIVRHQTVAPHNELDTGLALAHAGVAGDHDALAVDVQQHAVAGDAGRQHTVEILNGVAGEFHRGLLGPQQRLFMFPGALQTLREAVQSPGDDQRRNIIEKQVIEALAALGLRQAAQIGDLRFADDLKAPGIKIVVKIMELEAGTVHVRDRQPCLIVAVSFIQDFQVEFLDKFRDLQSVFTHKTIPRLSGTAPAAPIFPAPRTPGRGAKKSSIQNYSYYI